jgi:polar amino acid transport system substrate-binding protein
MSMSTSITQAFTPTGTLRASINLGNPILANRDVKTGEPVGVSIDLARAFAAQLGVALELLVFDTAGKSVDAVTREEADIGFFAIGPGPGRMHQLHRGLCADRRQLPGAGRLAHSIE